MIYILTTVLNNHKKTLFELRSLYGVGKFQAYILCNLLNFGTNCKINDLTQTQIYKLLKQIEENDLIIENELQKQKQSFISELIELKCYRGIRHVFHLPARGQRTRTNSRTKKRLKINR
uniref:Ribosomal protein S13 n=1 Tax=Chroomonas placoidea TaxID=173977 RepID=A0A2P1G838_9CRYP|nr:ribosomal protein S13 [Chroomonas placoidea]AVM81110.1 ribosomal protein S13 [Chroomonas placoidea]